jgi:hypothetical protein
VLDKVREYTHAGYIKRGYANHDIWTKHGIAQARVQALHSRWTHSRPTCVMRSRSASTTPRLPTSASYSASARCSLSTTC